jgi:hypothetical protein
MAPSNLQWKCTSKRSAGDAYCLVQSRNPMALPPCRTHPHYTRLYCAHLDFVQSGVCTSTVHTCILQSLERQILQMCMRTRIPLKPHSGHRIQICRGCYAMPQVCVWKHTYCLYCTRLYYKHRCCTHVCCMRLPPNQCDSDNNRLASSRSSSAGRGSRRVVGGSDQRRSRCGGAASRATRWIYCGVGVGYRDQRPSRGGERGKANDALVLPQRRCG